MTVPVAYPCKNARKVVEELKGSAIFGTVDLYKGYFQLKVSEGTSELLAVVTPDGLYLPTTAPFGPKQVPAAFQSRISEQVLCELEGKGMSSYIDDICLHAKTPDEFLSNLKKLLDRLREFDLRLNGAKCTLGGDEVDFLGMTVDGQGVRHMEERKAAMADLCPPRNRKQLRSFLGMAGYFCSHIPNFARKTKPLTSLTSQAVGDKEAGFRSLWGERQATAFSAIKQDMVDVKMLKFVDYLQKIRIRTDASVDGCGAVMYQVVDGIEQPVAYLSKTFTDTERRWSTIEQETFAVYYAITLWQDYLLGHQFEVETDHRNILWLYKSNAPKILRWRLYGCKSTISVSNMWRGGTMLLPTGSAGSGTLLNLHWKRVLRWLVWQLHSQVAQTPYWHLWRSPGVRILFQIQRPCVLFRLSTMMWLVIGMLGPLRSICWLKAMAIMSTCVITPTILSHIARCVRN